MTFNSESILNIIKSRRTIYPPLYIDKKIERNRIEKIIEAGTWAPNHGSTEPWRFFVYEGTSRNRLASFLSNEYKQQFPGKLFNQKKFENLKTWPLKTPVLIAVAMKRTVNSTIPIIEEERAVACCIQNMLLMATSFGIASYWSSGKVIYSETMKSWLKLSDEDQVIGLVYLGYSESSSTKKRNPFPLKTEWHNE